MKRNRLHFQAYFWCIAALGFASAARANDSAMAGVGGSLHPLRGEHPNIQMVRETVRLDIHQEYYDVVARFTFRNRGAATNVEMGFPERGYGDISGDNGFKNFSSTVDGKPLKTTRVEKTVDSHSADYRALWVKKVRFGARQTRGVSVRYRAPVGQAIQVGLMRFASYDFTGGNWRGKVEKSELICVFHVPGTIIAGAYADDEPLAMRRSGRTFTKVWRNWEAQSSFGFNWVRTLAGWRVLSGNSDVLPGGSKAEVFLPDTRAPRPKTNAEPLDFRPPALLRAGRTFIALDTFELFLLQQSADAKREDKTDSKVAGTSAFLQLNGRRLSFVAGQKHFRDAGKNKLLAAAPFQIDEKFYLPLAPLVQLLGGTFSLSGERGGLQRDVHLKIPAWWKSTP